MRSVSYYPNIGISRRGHARVKTGDYEAARWSSVVVHILVFVRSCASLERVGQRPVSDLVDYSSFRRLLVFPAGNLDPRRLRSSYNSAA